GIIIFLRRYETTLLSQNWERGANSLVPLLPSWDSGLGDEGKTSSQSRFFLKLTPMARRPPHKKLEPKTLKLVGFNTNFRVLNTNFRVPNTNFRVPNMNF
ncbi:MAG: hypothetical protein ACYTXY_17350, partial [Nostoc sp.]